MTDLDAYRRYLEVERGLQPRTISAYLHEVDDWDAWCHGLTQPLEQSTREWLGERGGSASAVIRRLAAVRSYARFARIPDPTADLSRPKHRRHLPRPVDDLEERLAACDDPETVALARFLSETGLRVSEAANVLAITIDIDGDELSGSVTVRGKGDRDRLVPLTRDAIAAWGQLRRGKYRPSVRSIQRRVAELGVTPHRLRHTFATRLIASGADIGDVQQLLGHASPVTTSVYAAYGQPRLKEAVERASAMKGGS